ncbi:MAG: primase [Solirubrobacterales bacterium]|nr:primase [Solirubrobacterales bacterium]
MTAPTSAILEHSAGLFEDYLWNSDIGANIQTRITRWGIDIETMRAFGIGYSPGKSSLYLTELERFDLTPADALGAGMATESTRGRIHVRFHDRIMFPIRDRGGTLTGFAGLATHLGPSWPLWLISADDGRFDSSSALFGIDRAWEAIAGEGRALVLRDPVQVLALHQDGRHEAVAVVQSPITRSHTAQLATALSARDVDFTRRDGYLGVVAGPAGEEVPDSSFASRQVPSGFTLIHSRRRKGRVRTAVEPAADLDDIVIPTRPWVYLAGGIIGFGIPIGLLLIAGPEGDGKGDSAALNIVIIGVATTYLLLALAVARVSASAGQPNSRRMRLPWVRGSGEVQPEGWTYHRLEEIVVGAALVSAAICVVLLMTVGGFLG